MVPDGQWDGGHRQNYIPPTLSGDNKRVNWPVSKDEHLRTVFWPLTKQNKQILQDVLITKQLYFMKLKNTIAYHIWLFLAQDISGISLGLAWGWISTPSKSKIQ